MNTTKNNLPRAIIILIVLASILAAFAGILIVKHFKTTADQLPVLGTIPDFTFTERNEKPFGLTQMKGKINVVNFMYTSCPMLCPMMSAQLRELYDFFKNNDRIQFVSISVDPDYDSLSVLSRYASDLGVSDNRWVFLRGPLDEVAKLSEKGFMLSAENMPSGHSSKFILVDDKTRIRGYYDSYSKSDQELLKKHLQLLDWFVQWEVR